MYIICIAVLSLL